MPHPKNRTLSSFFKKIEKCITVVLLVGFSLSPSLALSANPPAPFSPSDNVLDPNCLPTDPNCYVSVSNLTLNNATTTSLSVLANTALGGNISLSGSTSTVTEHNSC